MGVLPTGGGKSLCYQIPAAILPGLTLVVSPLVSLMGDQVRRAQDAGLRAAALHAGLSRLEMAHTEGRLRRGELQLLLLAPERFASQRFASLLTALEVSLLAVDEAHCISMWGNDFRPSYSKLGEVRTRIGGPILALTATATPRVRRDIEASLGMTDPVRIQGSFDRTNLLWAVRRLREPRGREGSIRRIVRGFQGARLVYAASRARVERIRSSLARHGIRAEAYHAGLHADERTRVQEYFLSDDAPVVVATNAFGMGIDRADVRLVVHDQLPGSLEAYYQEAGRAGRDGRAALCLGFSLAGDHRIHRAFLDQSHPPLRASWSFGARSGARTPAPISRRLRLRHAGMRKLRAVRRYARSRSCRRRVILRWFGEELRSSRCGACDRCADWAELLERTDRR